MSDDLNRYRVNFFKPKTDHAKANMKMVVIMLTAWAVAVFGFQLLLLAIEKPTAERTLGQYESVASVVAEGKATAEQKQTLARSLLMVLGKNIVLKDSDKAILKNTLCNTIASIDPKATETPEAAAKAIGLGSKDFDPILTKILASSLVPVKPLSAEDKEKLPKIMNLYLTHNQSVLTDTRFLGFPLHYWYTAQFLLILFVVLCWLFCKQTDKANRKFNLETEEVGDEQ